MPTSNSVQDLMNAPWYQSSTGPGFSATLISIAGNIIPIANLLLAQNGINLLPAQVNEWISLGVFLVFSGRAAYFYVRAKNVFAHKLGQLQRANEKLTHQLSSGASVSPTGQALSRGGGY